MRLKGGLKYSEKTRPSATLSTTNLKCADLAMDLAPNQLHHGTAPMDLAPSQLHHGTAPMDLEPNQLHHGTAPKPVCFQLRTQMTVI